MCDLETKPIRTEAEYCAAVERIARLIGAELGTLASKELCALVEAVETYESTHFPMDEPDPEMLRQFELEQQRDPG